MTWRALDESWEIVPLDPDPRGKRHRIPFVKWSASEGGTFNSETFSMQKFVDESASRLPERLRLASAAPEMARALLFIDERLEVRPEFHEAIDAALRKAGVR